MKQLLLILLFPFCSFGQQWSMWPGTSDAPPTTTYSVVATTWGTSTTTTSTTPSVNTTGAKLIVLGINGQAGFTPTVSDSKGNTWTFIRTDNFAAQSNLYYCYNCSVGSGHTFTVSSGVTLNTIYVLAASGGTTGPLDKQSAGTGSSSTAAPASVTPAVNNEIVITMVNSYGNAATPTVSAPFTVTNANGVIAATSWAGGMAYNIQTTAVASSPTWNVGASVNWVSQQVTFK